MAGDTSTAIIDLNVGGIVYTTSLSTLTKEPGTRLCFMFTQGLCDTPKDSKGRYFIDRDGQLFRYILDYLRNAKLFVPHNFQEWDGLRCEAEYFELPNLITQLPSSPNKLCTSPVILGPRKKRPSATDMSGKKGGQGYIVVGYRGTFAFGRDMSDVKFRKLNRILIHGKVVLCKEVFKDTLNESRDPDRGLHSDRYTARYYLKHTILEQAFDQLSEAGFRMVGACGTGTSAPTSLQDLKPGQISVEDQWNHYNEFVFVREDYPVCTNCLTTYSPILENSCE